MPAALVTMVWSNTNTNKYLTTYNTMGGKFVGAKWFTALTGRKETHRKARTAGCRKRQPYSANAGRPLRGTHRTIRVYPNHRQHTPHYTIKEL